MAATLATCDERFLAAARPLHRLRPHTRLSPEPAGHGV